MSMSMMSYRCCAPTKADFSGTSSRQQQRSAGFSGFMHNFTQKAQLNFTNSLLSLLSLLLLSNIVISIGSLLLSVIIVSLVLVILPVIIIL